MKKVEIINNTNKDINVLNDITYNKKSKECAYCRVSTDQFEQKISFESQKMYYENKIKNKQDAIFAGIYADEGISGAQARKRPKFLEMIADAKSGKINRIWVKNISRFARNTIEALQYAKDLRSYGVSVFFEEENLDSLDPKNDFIFTILSATAQQELINTSEHMKMGLKAKMGRGEFVGTAAPYGYIYNKDTKELIINEKEAEVVRLIFKLRREGNGCRRIANYLNDHNIPSATGGKWVNSTIVRMLKNEKYCGDLVQGKKYVVDPISKKIMLNKGEMNLYIVRNNHPAIITREEFDYVNTMVEESANKFNYNKIGKRVSNMNERYAFSSKIECGFCNRHYVRRINNPKNRYRTTVWSCDTVIRKGKSKCIDSLSSIPEDTLKNIYIDAINCYIEKDESIVNEVLKDVTELLNEKTNNVDFEKIKKVIAGLNIQKERLISLFVQGIINQEELEKEKIRIQDDINKYESQIEDVEEGKQRQLDLKKQLEEISDILHNSNLTEFDDQLFRQTVDKIIVGGINEQGEKDKNMVTIVFNLSDSMVYDASLYSRKSKKEYTYKNVRFVESLDEGVNQSQSQQKVNEDTSLNVSTKRSCEFSDFVI